MIFLYFSRHMNMLPRKLVRSVFTWMPARICTRSLSLRPDQQKFHNESAHPRAFNQILLQSSLWLKVKAVRSYTVNSEFDSDSKDRTKDKNEEDIRVEILDNALKYVPLHGWTREALAKGADDSGFSTVAEGMFKRGGADLVLHFVKTNNDELVNYMEKLKKSEQDSKVSHFIRDVLEQRLRMLIPYISVWPEAMAFLIQPAVVADSTQELGRMVDDIWFHAGDTSTDFNWYTKRGMLAKLFVSTQMVMIKDQSPDFIDTWEFLDRRMRDIATFGRVSHSVQNQGKMMMDIAFAGFTVASNIIGFGDRKR